MIKDNYYVFFIYRNHNVKGAKDQDPAVFSKAMIDSTIASLNIRYEILPYFYTLFYRAHTSGNLVIKGLFQEFPYDNECRKIDKQFLVGPAWLVSPVVEQGKRTVDAYFPKASKWYRYYDGAEAPTGWATLDAPLNYINLHVRGGYIIPTQKPANNTSFSRKNPFGLIVALDFNKDARGELFWDDGDSIDTIEKSQYFLAKFLFTANELTMTINTNNYPEINNLVLDDIKLMGFADKARDTKFQVEIEQKNSKLQTIVIDNPSVDPITGLITLRNLNIKMNEDFRITFKTVMVSETIDLNDEKLRVDCHPDPGSTQNSCQARSCSWISSQTQNIPWCFIPKNRATYTISGSPVTTPGTQRESTVYIANKSGSHTMFGEDISQLKITVERKGMNLGRIKIENNQAARYEVPVSTTWANAVTAADGTLAENDLDIKILSDSSNRVVIEVFRKSTGFRLFSTREYAEALIFSNRYIAFSARLATENVFGFGENTHETLRHRFTNTDPVYPVFARDEPPSGIFNLLKN